MHRTTSGTMKVGLLSVLLKIFLSAITSISLPDILISRKRNGSCTLFGGRDFELVGVVHGACQ